MRTEAARPIAFTFVQQEKGGYALCSVDAFFF